MRPKLKSLMPALAALLQVAAQESAPRPEDGALEPLDVTAQDKGGCKQWVMKLPDARHKYPFIRVPSTVVLVEASEPVPVANLKSCHRVCDLVGCQAFAFFYEGFVCSVAASYKTTGSHQLTPDGVQADLLMGIYVAAPGDQEKLPYCPSREEYGQYLAGKVAHWLFASQPATALPADMTPALPTPQGETAFTRSVKEAFAGLTTDANGRFDIATWTPASTAGAAIPSAGAATDAVKTSGTGAVSEATPGLTPVAGGPSTSLSQASSLKGGAATTAGPQGSSRTVAGWTPNAVAGSTSGNGASLTPLRRPTTTTPLERACGFIKSSGFMQTMIPNETYSRWEPTSPMEEETDGAHEADIEKTDGWLDWAIEQVWNSEKQTKRKEKPRATPRFERQPFEVTGLRIFAKSGDCRVVLELGDESKVVRSEGDVDLEEMFTNVLKATCLCGPAGTPPSLPSMGTTAVPQEATTDSRKTNMANEPDEEKKNESETVSVMKSTPSELKATSVGSTHGEVSSSTEEQAGATPTQGPPKSSSLTTVVTTSTTSTASATTTVPQEFSGSVIVSGTRYPVPRKGQFEELHKAKMSGFGQINGRVVSVDVEPHCEVKMTWVTNKLVQEEFSFPNMGETMKNYSVDNKDLMGFTRVTSTCVV